MSYRKDKRCIFVQAQADDIQSFDVMFPLEYARRKSAIHRWHSCSQPHSLMYVSYPDFNFGFSCLAGRLYIVGIGVFPDAVRQLGRHALSVALRPGFPVNPLTCLRTESWLAKPSSKSVLAHGCPTRL